MAKSRTKLEPGTWLERNLYESPAWIALNGTEKTILVFFLGKRNIHRQTHECLNCEKLVLTYTEVQRKYGISYYRMSGAIDGLLEKGFIRIRHRGGLGKHSNTIYALDHKWREWEPGRGLVFAQRPKDTKQGFRGRGFGQLNNQKNP